MKNTLFILFLLASIFIPLTVWAIDTPGPGTTYSYPLPAKAGGTVNVVYTMANPGKALISVYNLSGTLVLSFTDAKSGGLQSSAIDLCCLPPGIYLYLVQLNYNSGNQEKLSAGKLVVTN
jgi:hypothetical protein